MLGVARNTVRQHGFFALYRAYSTMLFFAVPKAQVRFGAFDLVNKYVFSGERTPLQLALAGTFAGTVEAVLVLTVMENLKIKLMHDRIMGTNRYRNMLHGITTISREMGVGGLFRGVWPTVLKEGSNSGIRFPLFELM